MVCTGQFLQLNPPPPLTSTTFYFHSHNMVLQSSSRGLLSGGKCTNATAHSLPSPTLLHPTSLPLNKPAQSLSSSRSPRALTVASGHSRRQPSVRTHSSRRGATSLLPQQQQQKEGVEGEQASSSSAESSSNSVPGAIVAAANPALFVGSVLGLGFTSEWV